MASLKDRVQRIAEGNAPRRLNVLADEQPRLTYTRLDEIEADATQPRKDLGDLEGLQASIAEHGIVQPLVVSPLPEGRFRLIAGERRFTAARALGLAAVPTIVRSVEDHQRLELQIIENLHRKDLNPLEEAQSYHRLMQEFGLTQDQVARRVGKSKTAVNQTLRILNLPAAVQQEVQVSDQVSKSVLLEIAKQPTPDRQAALWEQARRGELTVKQARALKPPRSGSQEGGKQGAEKAYADKASQAETPFRYPIALEGVMVTLTFVRADITRADVIAALEQALARETLDRAASL